MIVYLGADHKGFELKESLKKYLGDVGYEIEDLTPNFTGGDDYPDVAYAVAKKVLGNLEQSKGIVACGSGAGVDIVANKFPDIRSVLGFSTDQVFDACHDDGANVLSLTASFIDAGLANQIAKIFLETNLDGKEERFVRRLSKIHKIEQDICGSGA